MGSFNLTPKHLQDCRNLVEQSSMSLRIITRKYLAGKNFTEIDKIDYYRSKMIYNSSLSDIYTAQGLDERAKRLLKKSSKALETLTRKLL